MELANRGERQKADTGVRRQAVRDTAGETEVKRSDDGVSGGLPSARSSWNSSKRQRVGIIVVGRKKSGNAVTGRPVSDQTIRVTGNQRSVGVSARVHRAMIMSEVLDVEKTIDGGGR